VVIDGALIRHAAGDEEPARTVAVDESHDLVEVPDWLSAAGAVGLDDPTGIVGVDDPLAATYRLSQHGRFSGA
jgi:hypothetical protein